MVGIDKITPATPYWKINPKGDKGKDKKDHDHKDQDRQHRSIDQNSDDKKPHIDEFA
jgi:hypothetical protein